MNVISALNGHHVLDFLSSVHCRKSVEVMFQLPFRSDLQAADTKNREPSVSHCAAAVVPVLARFHVVRRQHREYGEILTCHRC